MSWAGCKHTISHGSLSIGEASVDEPAASRRPLEHANPYSLYSPPNSRILEQEEARYLERKKAKAHCDVEHEGLDSDALLCLAHPCIAVDEVQNTRIAAIGHPGSLLANVVSVDRLDGEHE